MGEEVLQIHHMSIQSQYPPCELELLIMALIHKGDIGIHSRFH